MDFQPVAWQPPPNPGLVGDYEPNHRLTDAELWPVGGTGPEDVDFDEEGRAVTGLDDGRIVRLTDPDTPPELIATCRGRPLGIEAHPEGGFVVCDADHGLFRLRDTELELVCDAYRGERFTLTNNAAVAADGTIYFAVSSHRWPLDTYINDLLERSGTGRLYRLEPGGEPELLLDGMVFANGVALAPDGSFVAVAETGSYRINRVWLTGDKAGKADVLVDALPGFPDNLSLDPDGILWCAFPRPRDPVLDATLPRPLLRQVVVRLPERLRPKPSRHGFVVGFDIEGQVVHNLQDPSGRVAVTTAARRHPDSRLFVGSLTEPHVAVVPI